MLRECFELKGLGLRKWYCQGRTAGEAGAGGNDLR